MEELLKHAKTYDDIEKEGIIKKSDNPYDPIFVFGKNGDLLNTYFVQVKPDNTLVYIELKHLINNKNV
jgi:hypothetical protein